MPKGPSVSEIVLKRLDTLENRMVSQFDTVNTHLGKVDVTLERQEVNLQNHMKRSDALEKNQDAFLNALKPIQKHVWAVTLTIKIFLSILAAIGATIAAVEGVSKIVEIWSKHF